ncbi:acyl carrier protein [Streptomyces sioyaensis]|uniref:Acyl carrier protein n=1 Tax=Streptomyces sioyaensis TaxID=67364 RepID=A0A4Q1R127_9ACTN|nr:acyl carrier protein [Streptomyces sioyaensis]MBM4795424.1 acyl carrier protein [Streptomyces sioyaensis]RXS66264.1 acyl carrier protein [Streptomyces sioyaensis]
MSELAATRLAVLETLGQVLETPVDDLRANPVLAAHAWDSLRSLEVLTLLEDRLGVDFDLRSFNAARTVDDLVHLIIPGELAAHH